MSTVDETSGAAAVEHEPKAREPRGYTVLIGVAGDRRGRRSARCRA
jgi:hypothetical protein